MNKQLLNNIFYENEISKHAEAPLFVFSDLSLMVDLCYIAVRPNLDKHLVYTAKMSFSNKEIIMYWCKAEEECEEMFGRSSSSN
ncbi:hypothetical protein T02_15592 [Trichinella nativa]|uniref:Uncharacterized protein n=1 Tax=Trichinella nativa TaxID=6335 RepID=A0A0V1L9B2_9BILA|nr:hypothetical protein T02_15592 [Trichinella nativa]